MKIISFTGKSGTGKSYQANKLCRNLNIDAIIDDGLFIYKHRIVAGSSAKKCRSKAAAMRTALFNYEENRHAVRHKIMELRPEKILVIGTSDKMVDWITDALVLPRASRRIYIDDVTCEEERSIAAESRYGKGEHVIPAPIAELKRDFAGYFINTIKLIKSMQFGESGNQERFSGDRTVVRPAYSYHGNFYISEQVLGDIIKITVSKYRSNIKLIGFMHNGNSSDLNVVVEVKIKNSLKSIGKCLELQKKIFEVTERMTAFSVSCVNININDIGFTHSLSYVKKEQREIELKLRKGKVKGGK